MKPKQIAFACAAALVLAAAAASVDQYKTGAIEIIDPWSRATPKGATLAGGYLTIRNTGTTPDRLVGGSVAVAKRFEMHSMAMDQGVMKMRELKNGIEIKPGETIELKPAALHLMFVDLAHPLREGERIKGTLVFEKAGTVTIEYVVAPIGARRGADSQSPLAH